VIASPTREEFLDLASRNNVVPVTLEVLADRETPVTAFEKLVGDRPGFLLESVEGGETWARWSFVGWDPVFTLRSHDGAVWSTIPRSWCPTATRSRCSRRWSRRYRTPDLPGLPPLHSGVVGYLGYDCVRYVEHIPSRPVDDRGLPEMVWQFVGALAAIDRFRQTIVLVRNVFVGEDPGVQYDRAVDLLAADAHRLGGGVHYRAAAAPAGRATILHIDLRPPRIRGGRGCRQGVHHPG
jgi:anthranilate synthase component I